MHELMNGNGVTETMSSLEIAERTRKDHSNVLRDIRVMLEQLDAATLKHQQYQIVKDNRGYTSKILLDKELTEKDIQRFWAKVDKKEADECWNWTGPRDKKGYGGFSFNQRSIRAHRTSAYLVGIVPSVNSLSENDWVLHKCDNPSCVNPNHLFKGSPKDNVDDMVKKGRQSKCSRNNGGSNGRAKITKGIAAEIRAMYKLGKNYMQLVKGYQVGLNVVGRIIRNELWFDDTYTPPKKANK